MKTSILNELKSGKSVVYYTVGNSMLPLLKNRQTHVLIAPIENTKRLDILLYVRSDGSYILHRLIKEDDKYFYMRGDNTYFLEKIKKTQAIGAVKSIRKNKKYIDVEKSKGYRIYSKLWNAAYPIRFIIRRAGIVTGSVHNKIFNRK